MIIPNWQLMTTKGICRKEFGEHLDKLRSESIKKKRELINAVKELD